MTQVVQKRVLQTHAKVPVHMRPLVAGSIRHLVLPHAVLQHDNQICRVRRLGLLLVPINSNLPNSHHVYSATDGSRQRIGHITPYLHSLLTKLDRENVPVSSLDSNVPGTNSPKPHICLILFWVSHHTTGNNLVLFQTQAHLEIPKINTSTVCKLSTVLPIQHTHHPDVHHSLQVYLNPQRCCCCLWSSKSCTSSCVNQPLLRVRPHECKHLNLSQ
mmetsp:Transcript_13306/g.25845  ORF Transcript_13306/g.25845 Transcript_13306/m.25845 type:complete len:216 (+) Transcript_13306:460-1107(+)